MHPVAHASCYPRKSPIAHTSVMELLLFHSPGCVICLALVCEIRGTLSHVQSGLHYFLNSTKLPCSRQTTCHGQSKNMGRTFWKLIAMTELLEMASKSITYNVAFKSHIMWQVKGKEERSCNPHSHVTLTW